MPVSTAVYVATSVPTARTLLALQPEVGTTLFVGRRAVADEPAPHAGSVSQPHRLLLGGLMLARRRAEAEVSLTNCLP